LADAGSAVLLEVYLNKID